MESILAQLSVLSSLHSNLRISNPSDLAAKLNAASTGGTAGVVVMADFDYTMTKRRNRVPPYEDYSSTYGVVKRSPLVAPELREKMQALFRKFAPYDADPSLSAAEKCQHMENWLATEIRLMKEAGLTQPMLESMISSNSLVVRDDLLPFVTSAAERRVPFVISTAGLADVVEGSMRSWGVLTEKVSIIGNRFEWNPETLALRGLDGDAVHTQNKEHSMRRFYYGNEDASPVKSTTDSGDSKTRINSNNEKRPNVILLGDSLGDARIPLRLDFVSNVIGVGFLNDVVNPEAKLDAFLAAFDVVLVNEETFRFPQWIFDFICGVGGGAGD